MKNFFLDIRNSFFGPAFYESARTKSTGSAVLFLFLSSLIVAFLAIIALVAVIVPDIIALKPAQLVDEHFPADLRVNVKDGKASSNVEQPYIVPIPAEDKLKDGTFENYFVIDTRPDITVATLEGYKSIAVLTESALYVNQESGEGRTISLSDANELTVDKAFVTEMAEGLMKIFWVLVPIALIFVAPFITAFGVSYFLVVSLVGAVIPLIIAKLRKIPMTYGEAYKIALYATVPIMIITTAWLFLGIGAFPMFLDVLLFAFLLSLNLKAQKEKSPVAVG